MAKIHLKPTDREVQIRDPGAPSPSSRPLSRRQRREGHSIWPGHAGFRSLPTTQIATTVRGWMRGNLIETTAVIAAVWLTEQRAQGHLPFALHPIHGHPFIPSRSPILRLASDSIRPVKTRTDATSAGGHMPLLPGPFHAPAAFCSCARWCFFLLRASSPTWGQLSTATPPHLGILCPGRHAISRRES